MVRKEVDEHGTIRYYNEKGQLHNDGDEPAAIFKNGTVFYYKNDQKHRLSGPAIIWSHGEEDYRIHGKFLTRKEFEAHPLVREYRLKQTIENLLK